MIGIAVGYSVNRMVDAGDGALGEAVDGVLGLLQGLDFQRRQAAVEPAQDPAGAAVADHDGVAPGLAQEGARARRLLLGLRQTTSHLSRTAPDFALVTQQLAPKS